MHYLRFASVLSFIKLICTHIMLAFQLNYIRKFESRDAYIPPCNMHGHTYYFDKQVVKLT